MNIEGGPENVRLAQILFNPGSQSSNLVSTLLIVEGRCLRAGIKPKLNLTKTEICWTTLYVPPSKALYSTNISLYICYHTQKSSYILMMKKVQLNLSELPIICHALQL